MSESQRNTVQALRRFGCPTKMADYLSQHMLVQPTPQQAVMSKVLAWHKCTAHYRTMEPESSTQYILTPEHLWLRDTSHGEEWTVFDIVSVPLAFYEYRRATGFTYWSDGITPRVVQYCEISGLERISVMDIGSNDGKAVHDLKLHLSDFGISAETTGVDIDYADSWQNNIDEFIHCNIFELRPTKKYDVVLCTMAGYEPSRQKWPVLIRTCANHLKDKGILLFNDMVYEHYTAYDIDESRQLAHDIESMSNLQFAWYEFGRTALYNIYCGNITWDRSPVCLDCVFGDRGSECKRQPMAVVCIPRRVCDTCGDDTSCYTDFYSRYLDGWHCGRCMLARTAPDYLSYAFNCVAGIASREPEVSKEFIHALLETADSQLAKNMLLDMVNRIDEVATKKHNSDTEDRAGTGHGADMIKNDEEILANGIRAEMSKRARTFKIEYNFPDNLVVAYEEGRKFGPSHDKDQSVPHLQDIRWSEIYMPRKLRTYQSPVGQRWAVNYLRHKCTDYEAACEKLEKEAMDLLVRNGHEGDWEAKRVIDEQIRRIIKNRIQEEISDRFPDLTAAAGEQRV